ncbi:MAG: alpha-L-rhamnosidase N-terminal domain-containing protein [Acidimicrobiia bacterium]|nr:alpha-L-rhamnosidase N-terminal domain-containing protein [Acidimicrobiia bacterium]
MPWVNGEPVSRGPVRSNPQQLRYDDLDLAPVLREGTNVIAVLARFYRQSTPWWRPSTTTWGLGAGALAFEAHLGDGTVVGSDETWRALVPGRWTSAAGDFMSALPIEVIDGRDVPKRWREVDFDDDRWPAATPLPVHHVGFPGTHAPPTYPLGALLPRPMGQLDGEVRTPAFFSLWTGRGGPAPDDPVARVEADDTEVVPARLDVPGDELPLVLEGGDVVVVHADFGEIVAGTVELEVRAPEGTTIDAMAAERAAVDGTLRRDEQHAGFRYVTRGGVDRFETFDGIGLRYLGLSVRAEGPVELRRLAVRERLAPTGPERATFSCSDPLLEEIWRVGRRTVDLCSTDAYLDCPTREQRAWTGDAVVHQMVDLATSTDRRLARWQVEMAAASVRPDGMLPMAVAGDAEAADHTVIPDWALHWVRAVRNLWWDSGDSELVQSLLPTVERVLRWFLPYQGPDGLLHDVTGWVLIDWSAVSTTGASAALAGLWARGLRDLVDLADAVGDAGRVAWAEQRWAAVRAGFDACSGPRPAPVRRSSRRR